MSLQESRPHLGISMSFLGGKGPGRSCPEATTVSLRCVDVRPSTLWTQVPQWPRGLRGLLCSMGCNSTALWVNVLPCTAAVQMKVRSPGQSVLCSEPRTGHTVHTRFLIKRWVPQWPGHRAGTQLLHGMGLFDFKITILPCHLSIHLYFLYPSRALDT